jgi:hypothetical protein
VAEVSRLSPYRPPTTKRLIVSTEGLSGCGKTRFALSAPKPLAFFTLDRGFEDATGNDFSMANIDDADFTLDAIRSADDAAVAKEASLIWAEFVRDWGRALSQGRILPGGKFEPYRSVVCDTGTELYQLLRLARYGRVAKIPPVAYPDLYAEFRRDIIKPVYRSGCNAIFTHKLKAERRNKIGKKANGEPMEISELTGRHVLDGFPEFRGAENSYAAPITLAQRRDLTLPIPDRYVIQVLKCAPNPELDGEEFNGLDFATFATLVHPQTNSDYWAA